MNLHKYQLNL